MSKVNFVQVIGHVGQKPELKSFKDSNSIVSFTMASNESYKDKTGEKKTVTEWHKCVCFSPVAEIVANYVKSGSFIMVQGSLKTRQYQDTRGENRYTTEIIVNEVLLLDNKDKNEAKK